MVIPGCQSVSAIESKKSLKRKWKEIASLLSTSNFAPSSSRKPLYFTNEDYLTGEPNEFISLIILASMLGLVVKGILVDQGSSTDIMFQDLMPKLGLSLADLSPYLGTDLSSLGPGQTRPLGSIDVVVLPLITAYNCVVGRPTLAKLGAVASTVHLKMKFHTLAGRIATLSANINSVERCQYLALKGTRHRGQDLPELPSTATQVCLTEVDARYDPDSSEEEDDDELARELKKRNKCHEPQGEFIEFPLGEDPTKTIKLGADLLDAVKESLITCMRQNAYLFAWCASEMPGIPLEVACHHLEVHPNAKCVA